MSTFSYFFDRLPVELLLNLFDYFPAHEILVTFAGLSDRVNDILRSYSNYKLTFKSIRKADFDLVCCCIEPEQVMSLTLCDDVDTPSQSQLFFSRFHIERFTRLQSLTLRKMEPKTLKFLFPYFSKLDLLRWLSFDYITDKYAEIDELSEMTSLLTNNYAQLASRLTHLHVPNKNVVISTPHPSLYSLKLNSCSMNELETIFQHLPELPSLEIFCDMSTWNSQINLPMNRLTRLHFETSTESSWLSTNHFKKMEEFLIQFPYLQHLNLKIIASRHLFNGHQWEGVTKNLRTFNIYMEVSSGILPIEKILKSFSSSFWLEEKRWFVACQKRCLFSIPHFVPDQMDISDSLDLRTTAPDRSLVFKHVKTVIVDIDSSKLNHCFPHVETVRLKEFIPFHSITSILDPNRIKHLELQSLDQLVKWIPLEINCPQLCRLCISNPVTIEMIGCIQMYQFKQIRWLELYLTGAYEDYMMEKLFHLFPSVQRFLYNASIQSEELMFLYLDGFDHLEYASFSAELLRDGIMNDLHHNIHSNNKATRSIRKTNFTYQMYKPPATRSKYQICWWIGKQSKGNHNECRPFTREHFWQQLKYYYLNCYYIAMSHRAQITFFITFLYFFLLRLLLHVSKYRIDSDLLQQCVIDASMLAVLVHIHWIVLKNFSLMALLSVICFFIFNRFLPELMRYFIEWSRNINLF